MDELSDFSTAEIEALSRVMGDVVLTEIKKKEMSDKTPKRAFSSAQTESHASTPEVTTGAEETASQAQFLQLTESSQAAQNLSPQEIDAIDHIKLNIEIVLGKTKMPLKDVLKLHTGSIVTLDKLAGEPVDLVANGKLLATGEVVIVENNFGIRLQTILK
jgi:flagellar motor switch protein FliN/FliY